MLTADIVVVGGNPGGCSAAIAAARSGRTVLLLEPTATLGGMNANGVCGFDSATPQALSGIAKEVERRIHAHYRRSGLRDPLLDRRSDQVWEPHVAAQVWHEIVAAEPGITVRCGAVPVGVVVRDGTIRGVKWQPATDPMGNVDPDASQPETAAGLVVIDASYEGDVSAWAGVPFRLGREGWSRREPHAGVIFTNHLEPSASGVLPQSMLPGSTGQADERVMAFSFRMICRLYPDAHSAAAHRLKAPPASYDPADYAWHPVGTASDGSATYFNSLYIVVNGKVLLNRMVRGNNLAGPARDYVLASPAERKAIRQRFIDHSRGYLYFIQNEGGMPQLGLADDEFVGNGNFPHQLYVREGRRIEGLATLTEADVDPYIIGDGCRPPLHADAVSVADWMVESQGCQDEILPGHFFPEGFLFLRATHAPFQIPYGCILPQRIDNLLAPGPLSATHIAFSAFRCEAARIQTGIAAGVAAALAIQSNCSPRDVPVAAIQTEIIARGGQLTYFSDVASVHPYFAAIQWAALRSFVPLDRRRRFQPDHPAVWSDFAKAVVTCLGLAVSVTGVHFENIPPDHPEFRHFETLYDLGTRVGVEVFDMRAVRVEDPMVDFIRVDRSPKRLPLRAEDALSEDEATCFLSKVIEAVTGRPPASMPGGTGSLLSRGAMCDRILGTHRALACGDPNNTQA